MARIKICGLHRPEDVEYANEVKPDWVGFVVNYPESHRSVTPDELRTLRANLDSGILAAGVFVDQPVDTVAELLKDGTVHVAQLHGDESEEYISNLREAAPGAPIWKAFVIKTKEDLERAKQSSADLILLDAGRGSGDTMDWSVIAELDRPYFLAGGLTQENIGQAVEKLHPYGVDISSGVETDRVKDIDKMYAAKEAAKANE